jgi:hypothetical protein
MSQNLISAVLCFMCFVFRYLKVGHLYILRKVKALELTPGGLHVLLLPILRKISPKILIQCFFFIFVRQDLNQLATVP